MRLVTFITATRVHLAYFWRTPGRSHLLVQAETLEGCFAKATHLETMKDKLQLVTEADFNAMVA